jgi:hypothetical protein
MVHHYLSIYYTFQIIKLFVVYLYESLNNPGHFHNQFTIKLLCESVYSK